MCNLQGLQKEIDHYKLVIMILSHFRIHKMTIYVKYFLLRFQNIIQVYLVNRILMPKISTNPLYVNSIHILKYQINTKNLVF